MLSIALHGPSACAQPLRRLAAAVPNRVEIHAILSANSIQKEKSAALAAPFCIAFLVVDLALRELEAAARLLAAVLFALDHARVAGHEAFLLERPAQVRLVIGQRARHADAGVALGLGTFYAEYLSRSGSL